MMRISGRVMSCCAALFLTVASVSAVQKLQSINDLKKINFDQSVPKHTLLLLYWFANVVDINNNHVISLTFDPNNEDYGSHHYGNYEQLLDPLPRGYRYYTVGNLNVDSHEQLPDYVVDPLAEYEGRNMDRIIFRVRQQNTGRSMQTDQVYITQHYETSEQQGTRYNPEHTYQVSTNLLRQIREFSDGEHQDSLWDLRNRYGSSANDRELVHIRNTWGNLACLGLLLFIVIKEKHSSYKQNKRPQPPARRNTQPDFVVNIPENPSQTYPRQNHMGTGSLNLRDETQLTVTTSKDGEARILWENVTENRLNNGVMVVLFNNNRDQEASKTFKCIGDSSGSWDTSVPLNDGLQARLHKVRRQWCFLKVVGEEICRGPEFKNPRADSAVNISGYDAHLQLFVKDGKACARLFVKKTFSNWKSEFNNSWVGFYASADKATNQYEWWQWQWATKFRRSTDVQDYLYDVYDYHSGMSIAPGVQARFIGQPEEVKACTPSWGG
ncbi:uncharacterized protein LOC117766981 isoform X2 [Hippoglossus hippoglossus]|uniref:uncharacterized protein LOC117766981 isoform X2 n=1 Tax=Hippoglossus hippoglossus TaxID=8267 RepID=UPI00148E0EBC|nr:uncharacterized protein LOC117766981 isoform X2 [Hippoglossus hippoglossus]XP_034450356.1 uncharacterized protein LOC117766981 isoform X2 [Hippoglossus hippoglossus]XP_034450357.1 uncharacterized protein LOC117766981 isoform X2 [Hippoglossus hippoglossus]